jgi:hypothetical protein
LEARVGIEPEAAAALLVTLPPGAYTAEAFGASGDAGIALVEVYGVNWRQAPTGEEAAAGT